MVDIAQGKEMDQCGVGFGSFTGSAVLSRTQISDRYGKTRPL